MAVTNFIPEIWSAKLLGHLDKIHVYASLFNRDYEGEIANYGDTVRINQIADITVSDYEGTLGEPEELDGDQRILTIDQKKYFNFKLDDVDNAQTNPKLMEAATERASYSMNDAVDTYLANLLATEGTAVNAAAVNAAAVTPTAANAYDYLVDLSTVLSEANVPMLGRWVVVPPWYHGLLLKDDRFVGNGTGYNQAILQGGLVGTAAGFDIHTSNNVPNSAGADYQIIAGTNAAGSFAEQLVELEAYRLEKNFSDAVKGLHVYGAKVVQPAAVAVLHANKA